MNVILIGTSVMIKKVDLLGFWFFIDFFVELSV